MNGDHHGEFFLKGFWNDLNKFSLLKGLATSSLTSMHLKLIHQWFLPQGGESFCCTEKLQTKDMAATSLEGWGLTLVCCGTQTHPLWLVFRSRTFSGAFNHWATPAPMRSHWWGKFSGVNCSQAHLLFSWRTLRRIRAQHTPTPRQVFNFWAHSALRPDCAPRSCWFRVLVPHWLKIHRVQPRAFIPFWRCSCSSCV